MFTPIWPAAAIMVPIRSCRASSCCHRRVEGRLRGEYVTSHYGGRQGVRSHRGLAHRAQERVRVCYGVALEHRECACLVQHRGGGRKDNLVLDEAHACDPRLPEALWRCAELEAFDLEILSRVVIKLSLWGHRSGQTLSEGAAGH